MEDILFSCKATLETSYETDTSAPQSQIEFLSHALDSVRLLIPDKSLIYCELMNSWEVNDYNDGNSSCTWTFWLNYAGMMKSNENSRNESKSEAEVKLKVPGVRNVTTSVI